jgi:heme A synthase
MHFSWMEYASRATSAVLGLLIVSLAALTYEDEDGFKASLKIGGSGLTRAGQHRSHG